MTKSKIVNKLILLLILLFIIPSIVSAKSAEGSTALARKIADEGMVLLKNNGALPVHKGDMVSVFGIGQVQYFKVGTGSGTIKSEYSINLLTGLRNNKGVNINEELAGVYEKYNKSASNNSNNIQGGGPWGGGIAIIPEMPLDDAIISNAAKKSKTAIVTFGRLSGEGSDRTATKGDYYLTDMEEDILAKVRKAFDKVIVVLNITGVMDMNWVDKYKPDAVLVSWLAGMEGGNAMADIICGDVNPSGKLVDTFAKDYMDYPSSYNFGAFVDGDRHYVEYEEGIYVGYRYFETFNKEVKYPFGYGLSYTTFNISDISVKTDDKLITVSATVKNTGKAAGKEVVQIYFSAPDGRLEKPAKELAAYAKTDLLQPGQSQSLTISYKTSDMSSYDEKKPAYILEPGNYRIYAGNSIKNIQDAGSYKVSAERITEQLTNQLGLAHNANLTLLSKKDPKGTFPTTPAMKLEQAGSPPMGPGGQDEIITNTERLGEAKTKLKDVYDGKASMKDFVAQLTDMELAGLVIGSGMGPSGNSIFGELSSKVDGAAGQTVTLNRLGIPTIILSDGPAGIRISESCTAFPVGTLVGCTWNEELAEEMGRAIGKEAAANSIDMWLAPGMNIHRNPLCGRNFEYYSEDPLISGTMAAAVTSGVQSNSVGVTLKHFAANNQETDRNGIDTVAAERTLREIYLKGFEIAVKSSAPWSVMTSYNAINGTYTAARKDLNIDILRNEWGFAGYVVTDWGGDGIYSVEAIKAGNDLIMPGSTGKIKSIYSKLKDGTLKRSEPEQCATDLLTIGMKTKSFAKYYGIKDGSNGAYKALESWFSVLKTKPL